MLCSILEQMNIASKLKFLLLYRSNKINKCTSVETHSDLKGKERVS